MIQRLTNHMTRGEYWQRLVVVKDARTHWVAPVTTATAVAYDSTGGAASVPATVTSQGAILLVLDETQSAVFPDGTYLIEVTANPYNRSRRVAMITLIVQTEDYTDVLPGAGDQAIPVVIDGGTP